MIKMAVSPQSQTSGKRNGKGRIANLIGVISKGMFKKDEIKIANGVIGIRETETGTGTGAINQATVNHNRVGSIRKRIGGTQCRHHDNREGGILEEGGNNNLSILVVTEMIRDDQGVAEVGVTETVDVGKTDGMFGEATKEEEVGEDERNSTNKSLFVQWYVSKT